ncbi:oligo-1,6-glucosidase|uniref:Oligo-1,6-glucosidase n=1 Tax=Brenneria salicis ATCC 15712 = DSM 30166 TaxID=714314 RepID=A0A366I5M2_9GAMM|nr:alpha-glucosidase [Brenneria salicis]NMN92729.1 oligo-1,6-glucosidase [Brenneria salicis ATCC 15712 = DSM 30166]RBP63706.1 oligo-1,6-glucosidase [Brenneria salicis ATCC 15712 = DSM 30166]
MLLYENAFQSRQIASLMMTAFQPDKHTVLKKISTLLRAAALISVGGLMFSSSNSAYADNNRPVTEATAPPSVTLINGYDPKWWNEAVVYQIYPRSYKDSNDDGIGDLKGIISKLDYIQGIGVNVVWICPHFDSPNVDNGYDIRDYRKVMPEFGTMNDFDELVREMKQRNMRLVIDLVVNHTSDEHQWFQESRKSKDNPYRDYYLWRPGKDGKAPNNYPSFFSGPAWTLDPETNEYYLHYFSVNQPDLNWDNPKVRQEIYQMMRFWLDKGVAGFRMDAISFISKDQTFPNLPDMSKYANVYASGPRVHDYLQEMHREVLSKYDAVTIGETFGITLDQLHNFIDADRQELDMAFNFDAIHVNRKGFQWKNWTLPQLKAAYNGQDKSLNVREWNTLFLSNHDNPRLVSSFGDDSPEFRIPSAKLLATLLLTQKGTPFIYQGDELGMTNYPFKDIREFNAIEAHQGWKQRVLTGQENPRTYIFGLGKVGRDNARTPMQWNDSANGGFTAAAKPWLAVNPNYTTINARQAVDDPASIYHYYRSLIALRAKTPALIYGDYRDLDPKHPSIYAYTRTLNNARYLIVLNFSGDTVDYSLPDGLSANQLQLSNRAGDYEKGTTLHMKPWEARIYTF